MEIQTHEPITAQPLDEEGDPRGDLVTLPPGIYRLLSGMLAAQEGDPEGSARCWVEDRAGDVYEARGLRLGL